MNPADLEFHAWPSRPVGGQQAGHAGYGVLVIHKSGLAAISTEQRSQLANREAATDLLAAALDAARLFVELDAEHERLRRVASDALKKLRDGNGVEVRFGACSWCGECWLRSDEVPDPVREAAKHDSVCPKNPLRIERDALREAVLTLATLQLRHRRDALEVWAIWATANDLSAPFSEERVQARLAEALKGEPPP